MGMTPERDAKKVAENELAQEERAELLIDGSERWRQRPKNVEKQKEYYCGKKKAHTDKNILLVNSQTRKVGMRRSKTSEPEQSYNLTTSREKEDANDRLDASIR